MYNQSEKHFLLTNIYHLNVNIINKNKFSIDILGYTTFEQIEKTIKLLYTGNYNLIIYIINNNLDFNYEIINNKKQKINSAIDYQKPIIDIINNINNDVIDIEVQVNMNYNNNENSAKNNKKKLFKNLSVSNNNFFYLNNNNNKVNFNNNENNSFYNDSSNIKNNNYNYNINNNNINNSNISNNNNNLNNSSNFINSFCDNINSSNKNINTFSNEKKKINFNEISNFEISNINNDNNNYNETKEKNESYLKLNKDFSKMAINDILKEDLIALCESVKHSKSFSNSKSLEKKLIRNQTPNKTKRKWEESSKYLKKEIILKGAKKIKLLISIINEFCNLIDFYIEIHNESLENVKKNITNIDNNTIINNNFLRRSNFHFNEQLYKIREKYFLIVSFWNNFYENLNRFFDKKNNLNIISEIKYNLNKNRIIEIDNNFIENNINDFQSKREIILKSKSKINYNFVDFIGYPIKKTNQIFYYHQGKFFKTEINFPFSNINNDSKNSIISAKSIENRIFYDKLSFCNNDNYLYISGGIYTEIDSENNPTEKASNKVYLINLKTKECNKLPSLKYNRDSHSSIFHNNNLYVIGGSKCLKNEVLNIFSTEWKLLPDLKSERKFPILFVGNNKLYVFGGVDSNSIIKLSFLILDLNFDNNWIENECKIYENNKIIDSMFLFGSGVFRFFFNDEDALYFFGGFTKNNNIYNSNKKKKNKENLIVYNNNIYKYKFNGNKFYKLNNKQTESIFFEESCLKFFFSEDILRCDESIFFGIGVKKNNEIMPFCIDPIEYLK